MVSLAEDDMGNASKWKESLAQRTAARQNINLMQLVYGKPASKSPNEMQETSASDSEDDEFFRPKGEGNQVYYAIYLHPHPSTSEMPV